jgi:predicted RNase H-like nuclease (RuvC/YqgF family)
VNNTNAERQRRYIAKLKAQAKAAQGVSNGKIEAELAALKTENARLEAELKRERSRAGMFEAGLKLAQRQARPKAAKAPLPPDEARERTIKALRTQVRNLKAELRYAYMTKVGVMNFATMNVISKALHPDHKPSATEREEAYKLFTAWKADKDKVARKAKG